MRGLRVAAALGGLALAGVGAAAVRTAIVGAVLAGFWPFIAVVRRRLIDPPSR